MGFYPYNKMELTKLIVIIIIKHVIITISDQLRRFSFGGGKGGTSCFTMLLCIMLF
jgi:hypothetical protein